MPVDPTADLVITCYDWVPPFAQGHVRDLRARWACEEIDLPYAERFIDVMNKPGDFAKEQPFSQVPVLDDGGVHLFESGAILLHIAAKDQRLLPADPQVRASAISWVFAAYSSVEPMISELVNIMLFAKDEEWAKLRRPSLETRIAARLAALESALGDRQWLAGPFTIADVAMGSVLREIETLPSGLSAYRDRLTARPAFRRALEAQLAGFTAPTPANWKD